MKGPGGRREVGTLAWPLAVGMLSFTLMGVVDTLVVGLVGTAALAGVGLAATLCWVAMAFFRGLLTGGQSLVAAAQGAGDTERMRRAGGANVVLGLGSGFVASGLLLLGAEALPFLSPDAPVVESAQTYLSIRLWAMPLQITAFGLMLCIQGTGDSRTRMWASLVGNVVNGGLDLALVPEWGLRPMGEAGAAWATVAASAVMLAIYAVRFFSLFGGVAAPRRSVLRDTVTVGLPSAAQGLLEVGAFAIFNIAITQTGAAQLAASQIALNIVSVSFLPGHGIAEAGGVLVGRYLGTGKPRTAARAIRSARWLAMWIMGAFGLVFVFAGEWVVGLFSQDPEVVAVGGRLLWVAATFQLFDAIAMTHLVALRAAGDTRYTLLITTVTGWGLTVPLAGILCIWLDLGAVGAWIGLTLEIGALALITAPRVAGLRTGRVGRLDVLLGRQHA